MKEVKNMADASYCRHEEKYLISGSDMINLMTKVKCVMSMDKHVNETGRYLVRSIYFDDVQDSFLMDTINGVEPRYKWRIRAYDCDESYR